jgi:hypothetical protein
LHPTDADDRTAVRVLRLTPLVPLWTIVIPACLLLAYLVLAFETRPRVLWALLIAGLLAAAALIVAGVIR